MNQRLDRLDGLATFLQAPALKLIEGCAVKLHRKLMVVHGWRSFADQSLIYQKGRSLNRSTGVWEISDAAQIVTRAKPGTSAHNVITASGVPASMALDVIPLNEDGTLDWNVEDDFWDDLYEISWKVGLDPLGDLIGSYLAGDKGHFEEPAWRLKLAGLGLTLPADSIHV
jgi:hypothetical protein